MAYLNKPDFIKIEIYVQLQKEVELMGEAYADLNVQRAMIKPSDISFYHSVPATDDSPDVTVICFKNGERLEALMNIRDFEKLIFQ